MHSHAPDMRSATSYAKGQLAHRERAGPGGGTNAKPLAFQPAAESHPRTDACGVAVAPREAPPARLRPARTWAPRAKGVATAAAPAARAPRAMGGPAGTDDLERPLLADQEAEQAPGPLVESALSPSPPDAPQLQAAPRPLKPLTQVCPYILANEFCERLAYYGLATNLVSFFGGARKRFRAALRQRSTRRRRAPPPAARPCAHCSLHGVRRRDAVQHSRLCRSGAVVERVLLHDRRAGRSCG